jgi:prefoldin subunit 5
LGLAQINIKFSADLRGFSTEMQNSIRRIGALGKELQNTGKNLSTYVSLPLVAAGAAAVKFASDYQESVNKVDVAFGPAADSVKEFAKTSLESFGIAEGSALDMAATFGDMATGLGLSQDKAASMSKSLVGLAGDLASFKNISIDIANTALTGIFTGETESIKKLGIVMTETNLQAFALSNGITKQFKDMSQAEKVALRYNYVLSVTKNSQGDFVRTGGGAANQMRIFQESLKQVAQQLGSVILPAFTKLITFVNGVVKSFSGLSEGTKTTIVVLAGIAAAIGPVLTVMGSLLTFVPNVITKFNSLKDSISGMITALAANPFTAIAVALAAIVTYAVIANSRFTALTNATKEFASINAKASDSIAKESSEMSSNLAIAKSNVFSKEQRLQAIKNLNAISPEFLGNITLENINTQKTTNAVNAYTAALLKKAKVQAAEEKLVDVQKKLLDLQLGLTDSVKPSVWQNLGNATLAAGNSAIFTARTAQTVADNFGVEYGELVKLQGKLTSFIGTNKDYKTANDDVNLSLAETIKNQEAQLKVGTIAFFEKQIQDLQKLQKEIPTTNAAWQTYEDKISSVQKKIDAISKAPVTLPKPALPDLAAEGIVTPSFSLEELKNQQTYFEGLRDRFSKTSEDYKYWSEQVNNTAIKIAGIEGKEELITELDTVKNKIAEFTTSVNTAVEASLQGLAEGVGAALGNVVANGGNLMKSLGGLIFSTLGSLLVQLGKIAITTAISIKAIKTAIKTLNPAVALVAGIAAIALGTVIQNQVSSIGGFANGGVIGGSSFYGDKILARVNSGELVLNNKQQKSLYGMMNTADSQPIVIGGDFVLSGDTVRLMLERNDKKKNRTS